MMLVMTAPVIWDPTAGPTPCRSFSLNPDHILRRKDVHVPILCRSKGRLWMTAWFYQPPCFRGSFQIVLEVEFTVAHALCCPLDYKRTTFFFFSGHTRSVHKSPGQGSKLSHSSDSAECLTTRLPGNSQNNSVLIISYYTHAIDHQAQWIITKWTYLGDYHPDPEIKL